MNNENFDKKEFGFAKKILKLKNKSFYCNSSKFDKINKLNEEIKITHNAEVFLMKIIIFLYMLYYWI